MERHIFWSNFKIGNFTVDNDLLIKYSGVKHYEEEYGYDLSKYDFGRYHRRQKLRNCVHPEIGEYIFNCARNIYQKKENEQASLF